MSGGGSRCVPCVSRPLGYEVSLGPQVVTRLHSEIKRRNGNDYSLLTQGWFFKQSGFGLVWFWFCVHRYSFRFFAHFLVI